MHVINTYYNQREERLNLCLKYKVNCQIGKLKLIDDLYNEYQLYKKDKSIVDMCDIFLLSFTHLFLIFPFGEIKMLGYCLSNIINFYKENALSDIGITYNFKKYKLSKKLFKKEQKVSFNGYDEEKIKRQLNNIIKEKNSKIASINTEIEDLYCKLDMIKIILFDTKMSYIDGKLKPLLINNLDITKYNILLNSKDKSKLLITADKKAKVKTFSSTIKVK